MELKAGFQPDVPTLNPDRTGTGGFDESSPADSGAGFF
jgi:hypothetical protein